MTQLRKHGKHKSYPEKQLLNQHHHRAIRFSAQPSDYQREHWLSARVCVRKMTANLWSLLVFFDSANHLGWLCHGLSLGKLANCHQRWESNQTQQERTQPEFCQEPSQTPNPKVESVQEPEMKPNPTFTELEPDTNIFFKYLEPEQNQNLVIKNRTQHESKILGCFPPLIAAERLFAGRTSFPTTNQQSPSTDQHGGALQ